MDSSTQNHIPNVFDRRFVRQNRARAQNGFSSHSFLCELVAGNLSDRLLDIKRDFSKGVIFGTSRLHHAMLGNMVNNAGLKQAMTADLVERNRPGKHQRIIATEEELPFGKDSLDLIISHLTLHTTNDLPGALIQMNYALKPDGLFLGAMFGGETLYELRDVFMDVEMRLKGGVSPRILPFADKPQMGDLLQRAGFALPVVDSDIIEVSYSDMRALLYDIRGMGEGNCITERSRTNPGKIFFEEAGALYQERYGQDNGRISAKFEIIYLIGWAPHKDQQKPLRPGSADKSLAEELGSVEQETDIPTNPG